MAHKILSSVIRYTKSSTTFNLTDKGGKSRKFKVICENRNGNECFAELQIQTKNLDWERVYHINETNIKYVYSYVSDIEEIQKDFTRVTNEFILFAETIYADSIEN